LANNALPNLTRYLFLNKVLMMMSALEENTSLLHLDSCSGFLGERVFLALAESLPEIKVLQRIDFIWCLSLASAILLLLAGLRKNTSLFRFHVANRLTGVPRMELEVD
jgi:hypothetical protein